MKRQRQQPSTSKRSGAEPRRRSWWQQPGRRFGLVALSLIALLAFLLRQSSAAESLSLVDLWLLGINLVTLLIYGYDKTIAASSWTRVPERVLLLLALLGGTVGALIAMLLFRHKTSKASFRLKFLLVVLAQVALITLYYGLARPQL